MSKVTKSGLSEELTLSIMACVALALRHVHSKGFLHLNIQPSSVYIMQSGVAKIGDFNCAQNLNLTTTTTTTTTNPSSSSSDDGGGGRASVSFRNSESSSIIPKASLVGSLGISTHYLSPELASTVIAERAAATMTTTTNSSSGDGGGGGGGGTMVVEITSRRPLCPPGNISEKADVWALGILGYFLNIRR
jgi:serine/threonine protein kinase